MHLIPIKDKTPQFQSPPLPNGIPKSSQAVAFIRSHSSFTEVSKDVHDCIQNRIEGYPEKMYKSFHHVNLMLPTSLAVILKKKPTLISASVEAFCTKVADEMKVAKLMKTFKPGKCLVKTRVRFTQCLYAMMSRGGFYPDSKSGWSYPMITSPEFKAHCMGAKVVSTPKLYFLHEFFSNFYSYLL